MRELIVLTAANVMVFMVDSANHITGKTGLTLTITASKNGAAFAAITPSVTERGNGWYNLAHTTAHTNTLGDFCLHITGTGADPSDIKMLVVTHMWDVELTGATHNVPTSSGRRLRQLSGNVYTDGAAQGGGVNFIDLEAGESSEDRLFWQSYVAIVEGTGTGQGHHIIDYNGTSKRAWIDDNWIVVPDNTSKYVIFGSGSHEWHLDGLPQAVTDSSITLPPYASSVDDYYKDMNVAALSGTGDEQSKRILTYDGTTKVAVLSSAWAINPTTSTGIAIVLNNEDIVHETRGIGWADETLVEILRGLKTRLASSLFATEHPPVTVTVTNGTELSGNVNSLQTINQVYYKVLETGQYTIETTYTGIDEVHSRIYVTYRYIGPGSSNHKIKLRIWNFTLGTPAYIDVTTDDKDLPATNEDKTISFDLPGTPSDYYNGAIPNLSAKLAVVHISNFNNEHELWLDTIGFGELEPIYSAPDNVGIAEILEFADNYVPANILSATQGALQIQTVKDNGTIEIPQGTAISIPFDLEKDMSGRDIFFGLRRIESDTAYSIPNGGSTPKDITGQMTDVAAGQGLINLTATETEITKQTYHLGEIQSAPSGGGDPVTEQTFKIEIVAHGINI